MRARELGISVGSLPPGPLNAITDVVGVRVGHADVREPDGAFTGVTVVVPHPAREVLWRPVFAGAHILSGNGELTGLEWLRESGTLSTPVALTNTFSVGVVRDALIRAVRASGPGPPDWVLPVVGETFDGPLNDIAGMAVTAAHLDAALANASDGPVPEGCVGAGSGTICHGFKGGIGTASRRTDAGCVGVLVQANQGRRERLSISGVAVGRLIGPDEVPLPERPHGRGSIVVLAATDAPLLAHQCAALARRTSLGIGRAGGTGESDSGDLLLAFATGNRLEADGSGPAAGTTLRALSPHELDPLFDAAVESCEEAIVNALVAADTVTANGATAHAIGADRLIAAMRGAASNSVP